MNSIQKNTDFIKNEAHKLGFMSCGIAKAEFLENEAANLESWLKNGYQGEMKYMNNHFDKRLDPTKLLPGTKSVISLIYNYYPSQHQIENSYKISKYAFGEDYHHIIKNKLFQLLQNIQENIGDVQARCYTDSAPILERAWAEKSGLGWIGKNSLLLSKKKGSFFFLAEILIDIELKYDHPLKTDHCGNCTKCIDSCPTLAILPNKTVDGSKCISYFTIELKEEIPSSMKDHFDDWIFGCDICQDVCPWNRFSEPHNEPQFNPHPDLLAMTKKDWQEINQLTFNKIFKKSAVKRTKFSGLRRNISFLKK